MFLFPIFKTFFVLIGQFFFPQLINHVEDSPRQWIATLLMPYSLINKFLTSHWPRGYTTIRFLFYHIKKIRITTSDGKYHQIL